MLGGVGQGEAKKTNHKLQFHKAILQDSPTKVLSGLVFPIQLGKKVRLGFYNGVCGTDSLAEW